MISTANSVPQEFDPKAVEGTLSFFADYSGTKCTEIRIIGKNNRPNKIGFYDQYPKAVRRIKQFDGNAAIYFSPNRINANLKRRAYNSLESVSGTNDNDVERLCWMLVDIDPIRPSDTPSTDDELGHAEDCQHRINEEVLQPAGAETIKAMSGNGTHTLIPIDYPNDEESVALIKQVLESLDTKYSNQHVKVDTQFNKQVLKLYGTLAIKGSHTLVAPYRRARIELPDTLPEPFDLHQLKGLWLSDIPKSKSQVAKLVNGSYQLDVEAYLSANGLEVSKTNRQAEMYGESGTRWTLKSCPFNPDHAEASVSQSQSGKLGFHCFHNSCQGNDWQAFKAKVGDPAPFVDKDKKYPKPLVPGNTKFCAGNHLQKTDEHFAAVFIGLHGKDVLWCQLWGKWLIWNGWHWKVDDKLRVNNLAREVNKHFLEQASKEEDPKTQNLLIDYARSAAAATRMNAFLSLVKPQVGVAPDELDVDPMLLNTPTGTIDLITGEVRAHDRNDKITKITKATFEGISADCPRWGNFLSEILNNNTELLSFMQQAIGYALTGEIRENVLFIMYGDGANGKTTLVETMMHILGDYAKSAAPDLLLQKRSESHPTGVADLMGTRFVSSVEVDDGRKMNEAQVKRLTGRDTVKARFMKQDFFDFSPSHKLFMAVNHRPEIQGMDKGIWRRIRLIPFEVEIPEEQQDQKLLDKLTEEASGILAWAVRGCLQWQQLGLGMPAVMKAANQAYQKESDVIGRFFEDCCEIGKRYETRAGKLYDLFREWCDRNRERGYAANKFGQLVGKQNNLQKVRKRLNKKSCYVWQGIGLVSDTGENGSVSKSDTLKNSNHIKDSKDSKRRAVSDPRVNSKEMTSRTSNRESLTQFDTLGETRDEKTSDSEGLQGVSNSGKSMTEPLEVDYRLVANPEEFSGAIAPYLQVGVLAIDTETTGLDPHTDQIRLIQIAVPDLPVLVIDVFEVPNALDELKPLFSNDAVKVFQNAKFDLKFLTIAGVKTEGRIFDTMLAAQLLQAGLQKAARLDIIVKAYLGEELAKEEQLSDWAAESLTKSQVQYAANDAAILLPLRDVLKKQLIKAELVEVATLEFDCIPALVEMELAGILLDQGQWKDYCQVIEENISEYRAILMDRFKGIKTDTGDPINLNSTQQLQRALAEIGINVNSTSKDTLTPLVDSPAVADLLAYKKWQSQKSKYGNKISQAVNLVTGRIHADYHQLGADTGRLSCSNPPLQQIPKSVEVRQCFIPESNCKFVIADYSQIELRVAAQISGDERMIQAYRKGKDLHKLTASLVTETPLEEVTDEDRHRAKAVNFGLLFAMGTAGLQDYAKNAYGIDMGSEEASEFREKFFQSYSGFAKWYQGNQNNRARELRTLSGRRRLCNGRQAASLPQALNTPIQGTAADIAKTALGKLPRVLDGTEAKVVGFIHDEFIVETPEEIAKKVQAIVVETMEKAGQQYLMDVPVVVEAIIADSWADKQS